MTRWRSRRWQTHYFILQFLYFKKIYKFTVYSPPSQINSLKNRIIKSKNLLNLRWRNEDCSNRMTSWLYCLLDSIWEMLVKSSPFKRFKFKRAVHFENMKNCPWSPHVSSVVVFLINGIQKRFRNKLFFSSNI